MIAASQFFRIFILSALVLTGCNSKPPAPSELIFSGHDVAYWLKLAKSPQVKERKRAIDVLGNVGPGHPDAIPALIAAIKDNDAGNRLAAINALSKLGTNAADAVPALEAASKDADKRVAQQAKLAIGQIRAAP